MAPQRRNTQPRRITAGTVVNASGLAANATPSRRLRAVRPFRTFLTRSRTAFIPGPRLGLKVRQLGLLLRAVLDSWQQAYGHDSQGAKQKADQKTLSIRRPASLVRNVHAEHRGRDPREKQEKFHRLILNL